MLVQAADVALALGLDRLQLDPLGVGFVVAVD